MLSHTGAPSVKPLFLLKNNEVDGAAVINIPFQIVDAVPMVAEEDIHPNFTRYDGSSASFNFSLQGDMLNFTIENADIFDHEGNYTVLASNAAGSSLGAVYLDMKSMQLHMLLTATLCSHAHISIAI